MAIPIKTEEEINIMREAGKILARILSELKEFTKVGISTQKIDNYAATLFQKYKVGAAFKDYQGYPAHVCTSINEQVVHTIPSDYVLRDGDIMTIDCGVLHKGFYSDAAITIFIGNVPEKIKEFVYVVKKSLYEAISKIKDGVSISVIGDTIQKMVEKKHDYHIVKELTGHGIGRKLHEAPHIFNYSDPSQKDILKAGMTLAIEPIAAMGTGNIKTLSDRWTIITADQSPACQWEHTILVTQNGAEILTE